MSRIVYVCGTFRSAEEASVSVFDRGFMFADGVYEVTAVADGKLIDFPHHVARLNDSLQKLSIPRPMGDQELLELHKEVAQRNQLTEGSIYVQVTRGVADRDFFYESDMHPSLVLFTQRKVILNPPKAEVGVTVKTVPDLRGRLRDIKSISLLAQVLAKQTALNAGCDEAWMVDNDGTITEGASSSAFIINGQGHLVVRPLCNDVLPGLTRTIMLELAAGLKIELDERPFTLQEAYESKEAFNTSACGLIMPVVKIDGQAIADGRPGFLVRSLRKLYIERALRVGVAI